MDIGLLVAVERLDRVVKRRAGRQAINGDSIREAASSSPGRFYVEDCFLCGYPRV